MLPISHRVLGLFLAWRILKEREKVLLLDFRKKKKVERRGEHLHFKDKWIGRREQVARGVGGCGVHFCQRMHQQYALRHRSACRIPAESGQEYLTRGKEYREPCKTQNSVSKN